MLNIHFSSTILFLESSLVRLFKWFESNGLWLVVFSIVTFAVSLFVIRFLLIRMPADYFSRPRQPMMARNSSVGRLILLGLKNLAGAILVFVGLILSLPGVAGQGIVTILIGISIMDFPGKRKLELKIVRQKLVLKSINAIRKSAGKPPLELPSESDT